MKIEDIDELFPFPSPGNKAMNDEEMDALRRRMQACIQRARAPHTNVRHVCLTFTPLQR
ncbi:MULTISPECIES: hypothetical protein [unclassified Azospirillum]|uniref:hypothetical protein n=1 Tax=unclassified Azospirillum TaxID=2630922 RepID=UPI001304D52B|nr:MULTISPECIES: hypothetical protein [unclassified Azospirillum]